MKSRSVLVTGASGGFGRDAALALAREGWLVFASMRDPARGTPLLDDARTAACDDRVRLLRLDVTDPASVERGVAEVLAQTGSRLDAVLNNAGYGALGAFEDLSDDDCRRQMETNFFGTLAVTRAVLPSMRAAGSGRIVIVSSNAVNSPHPLLSMYAASKWALEGWAEGLAMEVAPFGIEVVVVQPGAHRTPFAQHVVPVVPTGSPYARWLEAAGPGLSNLDRWGRDPGLATPVLVDAVSRPGMPFRTALGEDTVAFASLKAALPYEARAWLVRASVGAPGKGMFVAGPTDTDAASVGEQVADQIAEGVRRNPALMRDLFRAIVPDQELR